MFVTQFDKPANGALFSEAQGAIGDSGGGVFTKSAGGWQLTGTMLDVDSYNGQPGLSSVYGNSTYSADLSVYRSQIVAAIPEPGAGVLMLLALPYCRIGRRRARGAHPSRRRE